MGSVSGVRMKLLACFTTDSNIAGRFYWQKGEKRGKCDWDAIK